MTDTAKKVAGGGLRKQATDILTNELRNLVVAMGERAANNVVGRIGGLTDRLTDIAEGRGKPGEIAAATGAKAMADGKSPVKSALKAGLAGVKAKITGAFGGGGGGGGGKKIKVVNIIESVDVGVPVRVAYDQWTQFSDFPSFMKKVESVDQESDEKANWKAQVFWSHRTWEATIVEQVADQHITWKSKGAKGSVDGTVSFHELAPSLTRILVVLEYHPQGLFERTGNIWRAQGRRARLELKHFVRHVMTHTIIEQDELEGWRGEIRDSEVVVSHEDAIQQEQEQEQGQKQEQGEEDQQEPEEDEFEEEEDEEEAEDEEEEERPRHRPARPRNGQRARPARSTTPGRSRR
ncbi:SRPBCC family protein [Actinoplanes sp. TBRC 11911]|uniref:SRPBCC family protein n=1 Tax=Actinoplanes sp. TBRC 11911 TaxID=2729386 RepID=UPI00145FB162|nr:SRPBCC family protein [Actinoplanes sp. TBRC 11911]NMO50722.1 SRPBCC family protein [Actinoplanes sp. TBRC 11911]